MEYFRRNIIEAITAVLIMVVSIQGGMFGYMLDTQTTPTVNLEDVMGHNTTQYTDTENESNDEGCLRRVKNHSVRVVTTPFTSFNFSHYIKRQTNHIATHITPPAKTSRPLSTLFCTFLI